MLLMYYFLLSEFWSCQKCERTGKLYPSIFWEKRKTYISTHCCDYIETSLLVLTVRQLADVYIIATLGQNGLSKTHGNVVVVAGGVKSFPVDALRTLNVIRHSYVQDVVWMSNVHSAHRFHFLTTILSLGIGHYKVINFLKIFFQFLIKSLNSD